MEPINKNSFIKFLQECSYNSDKSDTVIDMIGYNIQLLKYQNIDCTYINAIYLHLKTFDKKHYDSNVYAGVYEALLACLELL
jgi:hypothetical protein